MNVPRIIIAGTHSGVGKTSVSLAIMAALKRAGYRVQPFKVGPDYIDPSYHQVATGVPSHNLDTWLMGTEPVEWLFHRASIHADIAIIEGVMGLFDGQGSTVEVGSTAHLAKLLNAPILLVLDARSLARSAAAMVLGYQSFDPEVEICGVLLNKVASMRHFKLLHEAIESYTNVPVLGGFLRDQNVHIPERHLGLKTASENEELESSLQSLITLTRSSDERPGVDFQKILKITSQAVLNKSSRSAMTSPIDENEFSKIEYPKVRIGIARDRVFSFYYQANLDFLNALGAELVSFSPLEDESLPEDLGALYFGGGFPEIYAKGLEQNENMRKEILNLIREGIPLYAECGGLMYLSGGIQDKEGKYFPMVGAIPGKTVMTEKLQNFGYAEAMLLKDCFLGEKGENFRGHEFHYSLWEQDQEMVIHEVKGKKGTQNRFEGYASDSVFASYIHCHFLSYPERALALVKAALKRQKLTQTK